MTNAYDAGRAAYSAGLRQDDNPYYKCFEDLDQEYFDWNNGWVAGEDTWFDYLDERESEDWAEYLAEHGEN